MPIEENEPARVCVLSNDDINDTITYLWKINDSQWWVGSSCETQAFPCGTYNVYVKAVDNHGAESGILTIVIEVNCPPTRPTITITPNPAQVNEELNPCMQCSDPDGDQLSYQWIYYREAGNSVYWLQLNNAGYAEASFTAPSMGKPQEMHFVLALTDSGRPALTRYKRVIVRVDPK